MSQDRVDISVCIPVYNEEANVRPCFEAVRESLEAIGRSWEIIFADDGSSDGTFDALRACHDEDARCKVISFRRNRGQSAAMDAAFQRARGDVVISMDGDLQNDPKDFPRLLAKLDEGCDVVSGWRRRRKDRFLTRRLPSIIANRLISRVTGVRLHDYGCSLKAYRADVIRNTRLYGEMHRFVAALATQTGPRVAEIEVDHHARRAGTSKYGLSRTFRVLFDLIVVWFLLRFKNRPMHFFGYVGTAFGLAGVLCGAIGGILFLNDRAHVSNVKLFLSFLLLLLFTGLCVLALGSLLLGVVAEMVMRTYYESQGATPYVIREILE